MNVIKVESMGPSRYCGGEATFRIDENELVYLLWNINRNYSLNGNKINIDIDNGNDYKVIFNPPAIILFANGKRYVSKAHDEEFDEEKGLLMCLAKANGITHIKLKKMIENAQRPQKNKKPEIKEVDINKGKSYQPVGDDHSSDCVEYRTKLFRDNNLNYTTSKLIINGNELCIGTNNITGEKVWMEEPTRDFVPTNWTNFLPKSKRGRPRKVNIEEPKPKRPVGRPKKEVVKSTEKETIAKKRGRPAKIKVGDRVMILDNPFILGSNDEIGRVVKIIGNSAYLIETDKITCLLPSKYIKRA